MGDFKKMPYILIVTSKDEKGIVSNEIKSYFDNTKTHYVVVMDENNYGKKVKWLGGLNKIVNKLPSIKDLHKKCNFDKKKKAKGYSRRISNAIKRFNPIAVVCPSTYGLLLTVASAIDNEFDTPIISICGDFTLDKYIVTSKVDKYIVENEQLKAELLTKGVPSGDVYPLGIPLKIERLDAESKTALKDKLGLKDVPTVFVYMNEGKENLEALDMLFDQGDIINIIAYVDNKKLQNKIRKRIEAKSCDNVQVFDKLALYNDYLSVSDILITNYDAMTVGKAFMASKAVIAFAPKDGVQKSDVEYLSENKLIAYAKTTQDVIVKLYDLLQTDLNVELVTNIRNRIREGQLEDVCKFIASGGVENDG